MEKKKEKIHDQPDMVKAAFEYINEHYQEDVRVEMLAELCNLSNSYFSTLFKRHITLPPKKYLMKIRLEKAKELLVQSDETITRICEAVGFQDIHYFSQYFKNQEGYSPSTYRIRFKKIIMESEKMIQRDRKDIFRSMPEKCYENQYADSRSRKMILPVKILWTQGNVENEDILLKGAAQQIALEEKTVCTLKNQNGTKASILLDFGVELHGGIRIQAWTDSTGKGAKVRVRFGESVSEAMSNIGEGTNATNEHARRDLLIEVGRLSMNLIGETGFRFVRIDLEEPDAVLTLKSVCGVLVYQDMPYKGSFSCDDPLLNRIWDVGAYTVHLNTQEYVWDGVKRDRLVWVGDMHPEILTIRTVFGEVPAVEKSLDFVREKTPLPAWMNRMASYTMWYAYITYDWYLYTGKKEFLEKQREYLIGISELLSQYIDEDGKDTVTEGRFLDWPSVGNEKVVDAGVQALHVLAAESLRNIFLVLKEPERVKQCEQDLERLKNRKQNYETSKQAAALLVMAGMEDAKTVNEDLLGKNGAEGLSTFLGYYILTARAMAEDYEGCLECIREYWGGMLALGATTFWEDFDVAWLKNAGRIDELPQEGKIDVHATYGDHCYKGHRHSFCHGWASGVTPWLSENVLGIRILEPGCKRIKVEPHLGDLMWAEGSYPTPYGEIKVLHRKKENGEIESKIEAPKEIIVE